MNNSLKEIYLAGGCFWGVEAFFDRIEGVVDTNVGYANGHVENPTYQAVCTGTTGYAETVYIKYDSSVIKLGELIDKFFMIINPTSLNKQGGDIGTQYRTGIYYLDEDDKEIALAKIEEYAPKYDKPIMVEVTKLKNYYIAEEYHQKYLDDNPNGYCHIDLSLAKQ